MTDRLSIYNGALSILGERKLANLTENRTPRYKLDDVYDNDFRERVLQHGLWNFAARSVKLTADPDVTPSFGYAFAFNKPDDFVRTMQVAFDEYFNRPITRYTDESKWIYTDAQVIYYQYVSKDSQYGLDFSLWPENFTEYTEHYLAYKAAPRLIGLDIIVKELKDDMRDTLTEAKASDAMESPAKFAPKGGWARSRQGFRSGSEERGSRSQLIG